MPRDRSSEGDWNCRQERRLPIRAVRTAVRPAERRVPEPAAKRYAAPADPGETDAVVVSTLARYSALVRWLRLTPGCVSLPCQALRIVTSLAACRSRARARRVVVCLEPKRRTTEDGIEILPAAVFTAELERLLTES